MTLGGPDLPPSAGEREVLRARARELARVPERAGDGGGAEVLQFRLAHETYGVETAYVREVLPLSDLTPVPCAPAFVSGLVNVRGQILCVIDLKRFYELPAASITNLDRVVVLRNGDTELGVLADEIMGISDLSARELEEALRTAAGLPADHVKAAVAGGPILLDVQALLGDPRLIVNEEVGP